MKLIFSILFIITSTCVFSQNTTVVSFEYKITLTNEMLKKVPPLLQESVKKQISDKVFLSRLSFKDEAVFYLSIKNYSKNTINGDVAKTKSTTYKDLETDINLNEDKIKKNAKMLNYSFVKNKKIIVLPLEKVKWLIKKETKKILNYNCFLATTIYQGQKLEVYFTKEIKGKASPHKYPFIDGLILEYNDGKRSGIATKIEFNQPDIKDFFK